MTTPPSAVTATQRSSALPRGVMPRGLNRVAAAEYVGVSTSLFDEMVSDGRMPKPKMANTRNLWDAHALDAAFDELPSKGQANPWDAVYG